MSKPTPYGPTETRISNREWVELNNFFRGIEPPAQNELYASGDHYTLALKLRNLGFRPSKGDAFEVYGTAQQILLKGWDGDGRKNWR